VTGGDNGNAGVKLAFERESVVVAIQHLAPLKTLRPGTKESKKYDQIVRSIRAIGLIEAPVVAPDPKRAGQYLLLDGHVRIEALKDLGIVEVECLISTDDETYTFNKRINRLVPVQEHRMIVKAVERGVPEHQIAEALGLEVTSVRRRSRMLDGVCAEAIELLKDSPCALGLFDFLRRMTPVRQVEAAELMVGQSNFTGIFAKALLVATPEGQLVDTRKKKLEGGPTVTSEQIAKMERELVSLQCQVKSVEDTYGVDNLHLTVAKGYVAKLLANERVVRWLAHSRQEYLTEFQAIAELETIGNAKAAAE
jgi:RepB plasmid partitioning protein/ParB-like nuclease domain